uniref:AP-1 complex subunit gamma n=1 Tax=Timspurckia oligopyrenoides TaxID=708627 RepID=A0A7S0ZC33_9RHOD
MEKEARKLYKKTREVVSKAKRTYVCKPLKDVIKEYRECKTIEEERALVKKECAHIRDLFREGDTAFRRRNVQKLVFFHMNGYPTDFGQIECLKLAASHKFSDKRVGYLGLTILLDENTEILMLITNALKMDLNEKDPAIVGLALSVLGDVSSAEMLRDLEPDIALLMDQSNDYIVKKSTLVASRIVRKVPDLSDVFAAKIPSLLASGHTPSVYHSACLLLISVCETDASVMTPESFQSCVDLLCQMLIHTCEKSHNHEVDVGKIPNPFLQIAGIHALRVVGQHYSTESALSAVLQAAKHLSDEISVVSASVLMECVKTIRELPCASAQDIRFALEILEKCMNHKDNTIKYAALQELRLFVPLDPSGVEKHREIILECLHHNDVSIRTRGMDLLCSMATSDSVARYIDELVSYLIRSGSEHQQKIVLRICYLVEKYLSSMESRMRVYIRVLCEADVQVPERVLANFLALLSNSSACQKLAVQTLFEYLSSNAPPERIHLRKPRFVRTSIYVIGEYGADYAASSSSVGCVELIQSINKYLQTYRNDDSLINEQFSESGKLKLSEYVSVRLAALLSIMKIVSRSSGEQQQSLLLAREIFGQFRNHAELETQQRACEFIVLLASDWSTVRKHVLESMPRLDYETRRHKIIQEVQLDLDRGNGKNRKSSASVLSSHAVTIGNTGLLLSLLDDDEDDVAVGQSAQQQHAPQLMDSFSGKNDANFDLLTLGDSLNESEQNRAEPKQAMKSVDPLDDLLGTSSNLLALPPNAESASYSSRPKPQHDAAGALDLLDLFGAPAQPQSPVSEAYSAQILNENQVQILLTAKRQNETNSESSTQTLECTATLSNLNFNQSINRFVLQVSVPRYIKLQLYSASSSGIAMGSTAHQKFTLTNTLSNEKPFQFRFRLEFERNNEPFKSEGFVKDIKC